MFLIKPLLGVSLLIWGRKLFWLFVAAAGFLTGWQIAQAITPNEWIGIFVGILFAILGALLAVLLQKIAVGVAGFLMGGYILTSVSELFGLQLGLAYWGFFLVGGIGGAILIGVFLDWALIWLSSFAGASLLMGMVPLSGATRILVFVAILFIGVIIQASQIKKDDD